MISHAVETCPDDPDLLRERLDDLARGGARILSVIWQPQRVEPDQQAAYEARGSFLIVVQTDNASGLRTEAAASSEMGSVPAP
jgi:hypothetical protein